jgi:CHAT domain-containing protein
LDRAFSRAKLTELLDTKTYSSIHLASHFVFAPGTERDSYLLLGDGDHLSLEDIKLDLRFDGVDLLTLSACNTAVGDDAPHGPGEGRELEGFAALTQRLGASAVIATLWSVADQSTADFMRAFYQLRDASPDLGKAEAMRQAALQMIRGRTELAPSDLRPRGGFHPLTPDPALPPEKLPTSHAHPYYWAPFVLIGNWR